MDGGGFMDVYAALVVGGGHCRPALKKPKFFCIVSRQDLTVGAMRNVAHSFP